MTHDAMLLMDIARAVVDRAASDDWDMVPGEFWCMVRPTVYALPGQGWKLHVSATMLAAPIVLARSAEVLVRGRCAFKFARGLTELGDLLSPRCERGKGGKFITAYPRDDDEFRILAADLDRVTDGLPGPRILSDRRLRPGSSIYYRYGVISSPPVLGPDGVFTSTLVGPRGEHVVDERLAFFAPPPWARSPLPPESVAPPAKTARAAPAALVAGRFLVHSAIRHSYRGGIFRATDRQTGAQVVLKQARPHVMSSVTGSDARDWLQHEARILDLLGPLGLAPRKVALVAAEQNLFLAEESVPGVSLLTWVAGQVDGWHGCGAPVHTAVDLARQLVQLVAKVHEQGLVLRDLKPGNLMVTPQGRVRLIDLEGAVEVGERVPRLGSPGYTAPEQLVAPWFGPAPPPSADLFSLGATLMYVASGIGPVLAVDEPGDPAQRTARSRLLLALAARHMPALRRLAPLIGGLLRDAPDRRWSLARCLAVLDAEVGDTAVCRPVLGPVAEADRPRIGQSMRVKDVDRRPVAEVDRLIADGLTHVLTTMTPTGNFLWKPGRGGQRTDACAVYHGAAGVLGVLARAASLIPDDRLLPSIQTAAGWVDQRRFDIPRLLPGLYSGRSGTAWAVSDAARLLGDDALGARAHELATKIPVRWPSLDVSAGTAGAGMALLHLAASTDDLQLLSRAIEGADSVLGGVRAAGSELIRSVHPARVDAEASPKAFAHGSAGVGTFLLYAALATGRSRYLNAAVQAGAVLQAGVEIDGEAAWWPGDAQPPGPARRRHWCNGSSGVGTFLIRLWTVTGEPHLLELAQAAAVAVHQGRWYSSSGACHGLAGDGDFLLDLAEFTGQERYRDWAWDLAGIMHLRHTVRSGLALLADDSRTEVTAGYGTGLAGVLGFLLRLRHGGSRLWMLDHLLPATVDSAVPAAVCGTATPAESSEDLALSTASAGTGDGRR